MLNDTGEEKRQMHISGAIGNTFGMRQSARNVIKEKLTRKRKHLLALELLETCIPWETLSPEQEDLLWGLFVDF